MNMPRWAVFISGTGSNLAAILDSSDDARVVLVVSSNANAYGLLRARRAGIPTLVLDKKIDWARSDKASAGVRERNFSVTGEHGARQYDGRAQAL